MNERISLYTVIGVLSWPIVYAYILKKKKKQIIIIIIIISRAQFTFGTTDGTRETNRLPCRQVSFSESPRQFFSFDTTWLTGHVLDIFSEPVSSTRRE